MLPAAVLTDRRGSTRSRVLERGAARSSRSIHSTHLALDLSSTKLRFATMTLNTMVVSLRMCVMITMLDMTFRRRAGSVVT